VYRQQRAYGASENLYGTTLERCLGACENIQYPRCKAAEWGLSCWLHSDDRYRNRYHLAGVTQFEIVRGCETSGKIIRPKLTLPRVVRFMIVWPLVATLLVTSGALLYVEPGLY